MATRVSELLEAARGLSRSERRELVRAWAELPAVWVWLRFLPPRRLLRTSGGSPGTTPGSCCDAADGRRAARLVNAAARYSPFPATCLTRSIVLARLLRRRGAAAEIRIGVLRDGSSLAHAWVEVDGEPVNDTADVAERHAVFSGRLTTRA
jgi:hypothetical protein